MIASGWKWRGYIDIYQQFLASTNLPFINADILAKALDDEQPEKISYNAAKLAERLRLDLLRNGTSFCFETVFSHPSKIDFLTQTKSAGYEIILVYIHLQNDQLNQVRVSQRVVDGGHSVPREKIISRIPRTLHNVKVALPIADIIQLYGNTSHDTPFTSVPFINRNKLTIQTQPLPDWALNMLECYL